MPRENDVNSPELRRWQVEGLRLTVFTDEKLGEQSWWKDLTGHDPENKSSQLKAQVFQEEGPFSGGRLALTIQPSRVDWVLAAVVDAEKVFENLPIVGSFPEVFRTFIDLGDRWLKNGPSAVRLALGVTLVIPVSSREDGYRAVSQFLRFPLEANSTDFLFRINRPVDSMVVPGLKLNRLTTWLVLSLQRANLAVGQTFKPTAALHGCRVEMDLNTDPEFRELAKHKLPGVLSELGGLAEQIAAKGDKP